MRPTRFALTFALLLGPAGCSSHYTPARSPRIATVMQGGTYTLVRDGREYTVGPFGGGVDDAVRGDPVAEHYASSYQNKTITGWALYGGGLVAMVGGFALIADAQSGSHDSAQTELGAVTSLAGLGALIAGSVILITAQPYLWDAINAYNDGVDARAGAARQPIWYAPPGYVPQPGPAAVPAAPVPTSPAASPSASAEPPPSSSPPPSAPQHGPAPQQSPVAPAESPVDESR